MNAETIHVASHDLEDVVRTLPSLLETLRGSYSELEERAERVEAELSRTNRELERRVRELDVVKRHLEAVLDSMPGGVVVRDAEGKIVRVNDATLRILSTTSEGLLGKQDHPLLQELEPNGEPQAIERPEREPIVVSISRASVRLADGSLDGSVEILDDQTERAALLERLHAADKMAALGTLAGGIAHEIRNPLNAVKGFAGLLRRRADLDEEALRWSARIVDGVGEVDAIIENLLSFGSPERLRREVVDPLELLQDSAQLAFPDEGARARIVLTFHAEAPAFVGDRIKLRQAVRNLLANAAEVQSGTALVHAALEHVGDELVIRISDAGPGIPPALRRRILEPFFTTRADGTGLGLALVATIARLHGGTVHVASERSSLGGAEIGLRIPFRPAPSATGSERPPVRP